MKLVDILARELKEWPEGRESASQDPDKEIRFKPGISSDFFASTLADDAGKDFGGGAPVTRVQWQAAVDALKTPAWNGEGLPPVGTVCEIHHNTWAEGLWEVRNVLWVGKTNIVTETRDGKELNGLLEKLSFRPIRTAEQIAAEERRKENLYLADELAGYNDRQTSEEDFQLAEYLYDNGYRKQEQSK